MVQIAPGWRVGCRMSTQAEQWRTIDYLDKRAAELGRVAIELAELAQAAADGRLAGLELKADEAVRVAGECAKLARVVRVLADL